MSPPIDRNMIEIRTLNVTIFEYLLLIGHNMLALPFLIGIVLSGLCFLRCMNSCTLLLGIGGS